MGISTGIGMGIGAIAASVEAGGLRSFSIPLQTSIFGLQDFSVPLQIGVVRS
ncbi:hypothetical protein [Nocardia altamirensis]|uniref:hypothetical protein n=1 Tax=Nocardia altamirensis TaxID=472158 RepID=UPI00143548CE|nr:hypothetical protein [Nocardia altamirensis]